MEMKVKINDYNDDLWCNYSKEKIEIGEAYIEVIEDCLGDKIKKAYKKEYADVLAEEEEFEVLESELELDETELGEEQDFNEAEGFDPDDLLTEDEDFLEETEE